MGARRILIDGISLLRALPNEFNNGNEDHGNGIGRYRQTLQQLLEGLQRENLTAVVTHEATSIAQQAFALEITEYLADTVIVLRREPNRRGALRSLEITKSRGQPLMPEGTRCALRPAKAWRSSAAPRPRPSTSMRNDSPPPAGGNR